MHIRIATKKDIEFLSLCDTHLSKEELTNSIALSRVYIIEEDIIFVGWLRYNLFWDNTPFLNLIYIMDAYQKKGYGSILLLFWEAQMRKCNYKCVMISTSSIEDAQYFYKKLGYKEIGGFHYLDDPYELLFLKKL